MKKRVIYIFSFILLFSIVGCNESEIENTTNLEPTTIVATDEITTTEQSISTEEVTTEIPTSTLSTTTDITTEAIIDIRNSYFQYSVNSTQDIKIFNLDITDDVKVFNTDNQEISIDDVLYYDNIYAIKSSYVLDQESDLVEFYLVFNQKRTLVSISINEKTLPYIISSSVVYTDGTEELFFQFELFGGYIKQVNANDIATTDYLITGNELVIYSEYISDSFVEHDEFVISYSLKDESLVIGMISIIEE